MHISDLKKYNRCIRLYQLAKQDKSEYFSFFNINVDIDVTIAEKLKINNYNTGSIGQSNQETFNLLEQNNSLFKARFQFGELRVKIPLVIKNADKYNLYFYQLMTNCSNDDLFSYACCKYVFDNLHLNIENIYLLYLNPSYIRDDKLNCNKLWLLTDSFDKHEKSILEELEECDINIQNYIDEFDADKPLQEPIRTNLCSSHRRCPYYDLCFSEELNVADNSILHLASSQYKYQMQKEGIENLKDARIDLIEGNRVQYSQIMADKNGGLYLDKLTLNKWLNDNIKLPISFIDFEWDLFPIPPYHHMSCLQVLPFQYSLHVYDGKDLKHYEFIGKADCRKEMIESMLSNIPDSGSIVAYNAIGAEMMRISELAFAYPEYKDKLDNINSRIIDLALPFVSGLVYDTRMAGSFTLKSIETMIDQQHSYKDLQCANGIEAIDVYRKYCLADKQEKIDEYYQQLYDYCGLDSYSLYKVYIWLKNLTE